MNWWKILYHKLLPFIRPVSVYFYLCCNAAFQHSIRKKKWIMGRIRSSWFLRIIYHSSFSPISSPCGVAPILQIRSILCENTKIPTTSDSAHMIQIYFQALRSKISLPALRVSNPVKSQIKQEMLFKILYLFKSKQINQKINKDG